MTTDINARYVFFQVEGNDIVKKKIPKQDPGPMVELGLDGFSKKKKLNNGKNINGRAETIPIKISALKSYSSADESNVKNKDLRECNVNFGYDAADDEQCVTVLGAEGQKHEKDANVSNLETQNGGNESEKHTKEYERGVGVKEDNST
jgi:hypothetical protein